MTILLTGSSGFLGAAIVRFFGEDDHSITSVGRSNADLKCDISKSVPSIQQNFDLVIHCAGKAHVVPKTEEEKQEFYRVNLDGTRNLLGALSTSLPKAFVFISTVAVYGRETGILIPEDAHLNGVSPYADSKIKAEQLIQQWGEQNGVPVLILRLPLIAGSNPPGNLGKMINGIKNGRYLSIAGGKAKRSVVLAEDVAMFIKDNIGANGVYNLTDGHHPSFREIEGVICEQLGKSLPHEFPEILALALGKIGDVIPKSPVNSDTIHKMTNDLTFDDSKARAELNWNPRKVTEHFFL